MIDGLASAMSQRDERAASDRELEQRLFDEVRVAFTKGLRIASVFSVLGFAYLLTTNLLGLTRAVMPCIFVGAVALWTSLAYVLIGRGALTGKNLWVVLAGSLVLPTLSFLLTHWFTPEQVFVHMLGPISLAYFIAIVLTGFSFDPRISIIGGVVSAVGYVIAYLAAREDIAAALPPASEHYGLLVSFPYFAARGMLMILCGVLVGSLSGLAKRFILGIFREEKERQRVTGAFGMMVDPRVRDLMLEGKIELGGETRENSVLFADVRGFTSFSQRMTPKELFHFMKEYFDLLGVEIRSEDGTTMEYVGDEVMVLFGAPLPMPDHARRALSAALKMQSALRRQNPSWQAEGKPALSIGIGVHTGPMLVGNIGSTERNKYGAIGDSVNLASRLQSLTKDYGVPIIASGETVSQCAGAFRLRELDDVVVRGRTLEVSIFEVVAHATEELPSARREFLGAYEDAFSKYRQGRREEALVQFRRCLELSPGDTATKNHVERLGRRPDGL